MLIKIVQGNDKELEFSDVNVVIDVIRAFTFAHHAFIQGAKQILLVKTVEEAFELKKSNPSYLLAGEVKGRGIEGFDLDNSPSLISKCNLNGRSLVQKTTNGVNATLHALNADIVFVTGYSNAKNTADYVKKLYCSINQDNSIHLVASHLSGDDDLACAEYIKGILEENIIESAKMVEKRIQASHVAEKFYDSERPEFKEEDIAICLKELESDFVMIVNQTNRVPRIERVDI
ncbi:2-phosphosulfolactate phosphatase [Salipaludibacillus sp. CF4.18]|uniref:2-phosphosulfolactate phosphatase n=1 Tax=Salipaludibacillus sp. CF4.18 TaxID=3373081 RepID=UPI003EE8080C